MNFVPFFYYYDELNNYLYTEENKCPENYNKMILSKKKKKKMY